MNARSHPARSLAMRNLCLLAALLPGMLLQWQVDHALPLRLLLAITAALGLEALALLLRRQPLAPFLREGSAITCAALLLCWSPGLDGAALLLALLVGLVVARQAFGGLGRNLFHPATAAIAFAQAMWLAPPTAPSPNYWLALAWALGGIVLLMLRIMRWQVPVILLAAAGIGLLAAGQEVSALADPRWVLAAFFIAPDSVTSPEDAKARALGAAVAGLLAGLAGITALPFALLAFNAATPALDAWLARGHPRAQRA